MYTTLVFVTGFAEGQSNGVAIWGIETLETDTKKIVGTQSSIWEKT